MISLEGHSFHRSVILEILRYKSAQDHEAEVDAAFEAASFPCGSASDSVWYLLTVLEDEARMHFAEAFPIIMDESGDSSMRLAALNYLLRTLDRQKYSLRHALNSVQRRGGDTGTVFPPPDVDGSAYTRAKRLLEASASYATATLCFTMLHRGHFKAEETDDGEIAFIATNPLEGAYDYLEMTGAESAIRQPNGGHDTHLLGALWGAGEWVPQLSGDIALTATKAFTIGGEDTLAYNYDPGIGRKLFDLVNKDADLIPEGWSFPWGGRDCVLALRAALCARCLYHLIAVNFGQSLWAEMGEPIPGGGVENVCLSIRVRDLVVQVSELSGVSIGVAEPFIQAMTLGSGTTNPDPALQPLIPYGAEVLLVPCALITTSNHERNLLSLHARVEGSTFSASSEAFEREMVAGLDSVVRPLYPHASFNVDIPGQKDAGEVDMIVVDPACMTVLVGELRWVLQPGDPNEVANKREACLEKVPQLQKKVEGVISGLSAVLRMLDVPSDGLKEWVVVGAVILSGYPGGPSPVQGLPIVPQAIFEEEVRSTGTLKELHSRLSSSAWLPVEGEDFQTSASPITIGDIRLWAPVLMEQFYDND